MITAFFELFAFGGILFWITLATIVFTLTMLSDRKCHFTKLCLLAGLVTLFWPSVKTLSGKQLSVVVISYFAIGITYSFIRWFNNVNNTIAKYSNLLKKLTITDLNSIESNIDKIGEQINKLDRVDRHRRDEAYTEVYKEVSGDYKQLQAIQYSITPNENKATLYNWIFHWPWSILRFFTADLAEALYQLSKNQYKNIVNHLLRKNLV
jgi:hypothetical protein